MEGLLEAARQGDKEAERALFQALAAQLRPVIAYRLRTYRKEDREDMLQDTLATFFEKIASINDHPERFALQILRNKIGNWIQSPWHGKMDGIVSGESDETHQTSGVTEAKLSLTQDTLDIHDTIDRAERVKQIVRAIHEMADFCRVVLTGLLESYTVAEIWERVSQREPTLTRGAFDKRIFDCKIKLRERLRGVIE